ncbi:hypothetical protein D1115_21730 [Vibrio alfacsensis]|uniref:Uncharacterized protein n=1 Tax=Vibrio alfacsensis TaxID=1074311 RepID=A0ABN5PLY6_9VIBR|nr:hypothetical protein [Vibrio alfacsensis]AXY03472.1 hypothetical protein D1115_21730 [Vibrio alfacsensis]WQE78822.1 hypothetical protein SO574_16915 [Vibrio alfacsensis]
MKKSLFLSLVFMIIAPQSAIAAQHDHDTLFSKDNAIMAAAAVETVNDYCVELGVMTHEYSQKQSLVIRQTIEGLSLEVLGEAFQFSEENALYQEGVSMGKQLISDAEQNGHLDKICTQPQQEKTL